jgi:hypothetical protein
MKFDITLKQYELIYKVVASVGKEFSHGAGRSCQFYNVNGALILEKIFKVKAKPVMGVAFVRLAENGNTLSFAGKEEGNFYSSPEAFHCWVETENNIIDFTGPEYREAHTQAGSDNKIERNMFQKEKRSMAESPYEMINVGDFYFESNPALTKDLLIKMYEDPATQDLAKICLKWCEESKKKFSRLGVVNDLGEKISINPISYRVLGSW